jgi:hypothetical protein
MLSLHHCEVSRDHRPDIVSKNPYYLASAIASNDQNTHTFSESESASSFLEKCALEQSAAMEKERDRVNDVDKCSLY